MEQHFTIHFSAKLEIFSKKTIWVPDEDKLLNFLECRRPRDWRDNCLSFMCNKYLKTNFPRSYVRHRALRAMAASNYDGAFRTTHMIKHTSLFCGLCSEINLCWKERYHSLPLWKNATILSSLRFCIRCSKHSSSCSCTKEIRRKHEKQSCLPHHQT